MKNSSIFLALILSCSFMGMFAMDQDQSKNANITRERLTGSKSFDERAAVSADTLEE